MSAKVPPPLHGLSFAVTGKLRRGSRQDFESTIQVNGGTFHARVSPQTDYLVIGDTGKFGTTTKLKLAARHRITMLQEADFDTMLKGRQERYRQHRAKELEQTVDGKRSVVRGLVVDKAAAAATIEKADELWAEIKI